MLLCALYCCVQVPHMLVLVLLRDWIPQDGPPANSAAADSTPSSTTARLESEEPVHLAANLSKEVSTPLQLLLIRLLLFLQHSHARSGRTTLCSPHRSGSDATKQRRLSSKCLRKSVFLWKRFIPLLFPLPLSCCISPLLNESVSALSKAFTFRVSKR
jgi:hypothetical protein